MRVSLNNILFFGAVIAVIAIGLSTYWSSFSPAEKWLYYFEKPGAEYAEALLTSESPPDPPKILTKNKITTHENYVIYSPKQQTSIVVAYSKNTPPPAGEGESWLHVKGPWYVLENQ
jgi:hypothetical protein